MDKAKSVTQRLSETISNLTEIVRINDESRELTAEHLLLAEVVEHIVNSLVISVEKSEAQITHDFSACPGLNYPRVYLESILLNLLTNALKYRAMERRPQIHLKSWKQDKFVVLSCTDNGLGIDLDKHGKKIFGLNQTFHPNPDARGVGLFITKNQIEALGGKIEVTSQVGLGTTFTIYFLDKN
ncbi:MAG: HAMP domain-containing histidine kinase [Cytophagales bacterium]|nr:HAMP domain-containing histidine kinase [Cytophagales bacterium]